MSVQGPANTGCTGFPPRGRSLLLAALCLCTASSLGCGKTAKSGEPSAAAGPKPKVEAPSHADPAPTEANEKPHKVVARRGDASQHVELLVSLPEGARASEPLTTQVRLQTSEPWHLNAEYPISLDVEVPEGIDMARWHFDRAAASQMDDNSIDFNLEYVAASSGEKHFEGHVKFAVCSDNACLPQKMRVAFQVDVAAAGECGTGLC